MRPALPQPLTMPAGRVLGVIVIALLVAALFNSEAIVRAGESMQGGTTRDVVLSVARPLDDVAGAVGLHLPREGFDNAFGQEPKTAEGTELEQGSTAILKPNRRRPSSRGSRSPPPHDPVEVLVTGDSQAEFIGQLLTDELPADLFDVEVVARNATGLTNPEFFNWEINAQQEIAAREPDAVVMVMGGNDGFNVLGQDGQLYGPQDPEWQTEYARRAAVVMRELGSERQAPGVLGAAADGARPRVQRRSTRRRTRAIEQAAAAVPGARYVDIFHTINKGRYSDELKIDGRAGAGPPVRRRALHARGRRGAGAADPRARWPRTIAALRDEAP